MINNTTIDILLITNKERPVVLKEITLISRYIRIKINLEFFNNMFE